jgi:hypothetical protein
VLAKALAKSPLDRYASCGDLVAALRGAVAERRVHPRRLALSLAVLAGAALVGAAVAAALALGLRHDATPRVTTVVRTQRISSPDGLDSFLMRTKNAAALNDAAYFLITDHEYVRALPLARRAVRYSSKDSVTYGYASFNYGVTLVEVGRCSDALPLLRRALRIEAPAQRKIIRPWVTRAAACSRGGASAPVR